jgi:hypothetical protein
MPIGDILLKFGMEIGHKYSYTFDMIGSLPCSQESSSSPYREPDVAAATSKNSNIERKYKNKKSE